MKRMLLIALVGCLVPVALGDVVISEWMYAGSDGEFIEFTNTGPAAVDMTGWSFDDDSGVPGTVDLSDFGVVEAGASVVLTEALAADFIAAWSLTDVGVIGELSANLGRNDQINIYDAGGILVDQLSFGDEDYPGTPRAKDASCNIPATDYGFDVAQPTWELAVVGDDFGSWASLGGDVGSPGVAPIPEPATVVLLVLGGLLSARRGR